MDGIGTFLMEMIMFYRSTCKVVGKGGNLNGLFLCNFQQANLKSSLIINYVSVQSCFLSLKASSMMQSFQLLKQLNKVENFIREEKLLQCKKFLDVISKLIRLFSEDTLFLAFLLSLYPKQWI